MMTNIHGQLDQSPSADINSNYDIMFNEIHRVVEKHISSKTVKFNKYKHKQSKWITHGVIKSIKYRDRQHYRSVAAGGARRERPGTTCAHNFRAKPRAAVRQISVVFKVICS